VASVYMQYDFLSHTTQYSIRTAKGRAKRKVGTAEENELSLMEREVMRMA